VTCAPSPGARLLAQTVDPDGQLGGVRRAVLAERLIRMSNPDANGCRIFSGAGRGSGYGAVKVGRRTMDAHRAAFLVFVGPIPDGELVCHTCDVRRCIEPSHLFPGTHKTNHDDMVAKGRRVPGEAISRRCIERGTRPPVVQKLTNEQVAEVRASVARGESRKAVAERFGVCVSTVTKIANGKHRPPVDHAALDATAELHAADALGKGDA
jgi:hypothetical protein